MGSPSAEMRSGSSDREVPYGNSEYTLRPHPGRARPGAGDRGLQGHPLRHRRTLGVSQAGDPLGGRLRCHRLRPLLLPAPGLLRRGAEPEEILQALKNAPEISKVKKNGKKVLITAGRTEEAIDPVRYISNRSSGKTAIAISQVFENAGFDVTLVAGPMEANIPHSVQAIQVKSAREMHEAVLKNVSTQNVIIHCAAVADYRPANIAEEKIKDSRSQLTIELIPNPNILRSTVEQKRPDQIIVGFALETANPEKYALEKLERSGADLLVLNTPVADDSGFGKDCVAFSLIERGQGVPALKKASKNELALGILQFVQKQMEGK